MQPFLFSMLFLTYSHSFALLLILFPFLPRSLFYFHCSDYFFSHPKFLSSWPSGSSSVLFCSIYIVQECTRQDVLILISLPNYSGCLLVNHKYHGKDTAPGAWPKRWKHQGGRDDSDFRTTSLKIDILVVYCI